MKTLLLLLLNVPCLVFGQGFLNQSQYLFNPVTINPGYTGSRECLSAGATYRQQWTGVPGSPVNATLFAHAPFKNLSSAAGITASNTRYGLTNEFYASGQYAYRLRFKKSSLALGLSAGFQRQSVNWNGLLINDQNDPNFPTAPTVQTAIITGAGAYFNTSKAFVGLSCPYFQVDGETTHRRSYYLITGYNIDLGESISLQPAIVGKMTSSYKQLDANLSLILKDIVSLGASYRTNDAIIGIVQIDIGQKLKVGYSYDYPSSNWRNRVNGSHEVMVRYDFSYRINSKSLMPF